MNETSTVLLLLIAGFWFFTNKRSQAFLTVLKSVSPSINDSQSVKPPTDTKTLPKRDPFKTPSKESIG